jgi:hypothetical protein
MSVQLILYPQSYNDTISANEFVVNGINFSNPPLSSASTYSSSVATTTTGGVPTALNQNVLTNDPPTFLIFGTDLSAQHHQLLLHLLMLQIM